MSDEVKGPHYFRFGEGTEQWAAPNPLNPAGIQGMASAYDYLVRLCPDTKTALAKLRQIRRKVRDAAAPGQTKGPR